MYSSSPHKWLQAPEGIRLSLRARRGDRPACGTPSPPKAGTNPSCAPSASSGSVRRMCRRFGDCARPSSWPTTSAWSGSSSAIASSCDYILAQMMKRGAESWTSPDPALRCAIVDGQRSSHPAHGSGELAVEDEEDSHSRRRQPSKLRLSTPYYLQKKDIDRFLETYDEYKRRRRSREERSAAEYSGPPSSLPRRDRESAFHRAIRCATQSGSTAASSFRRHRGCSRCRYRPCSAAIAAPSRPLC